MERKPCSRSLEKLDPRYMFESSRPAFVSVPPEDLEPMRWTDRMLRTASQR